VLANALREPGEGERGGLPDWASTGRRSWRPWERILRGLFDISFRSFVTGRIIGILYVISIVIIALYTIFLIIAAFNASVTLGVLTLLILGPLFFFSLIYVRVLLELAIVLFRIAENTSEMVRQGRR
jgi:hypothetical protein